MGITNNNKLHANTIQSLNDIATYYTTDKCIKKHGYVKYYEKFLEPMRNDNLKFLEIGIERGRSHLMWKDYLPNSTIYGIDIDPSCRAIQQDRIVVEIGNSIDENFTNNFFSKYDNFDVIIDDGSHASASQIKTFETFFPHLKPGGLYFLEDLHSSYWKIFTSPNEMSCVTYLRGLVENIMGQGKVYMDGSGEMGNANMDDIIRTNPNLDYYEKWIESITFYKSLCVMHKRLI